MGQLSNRTKRLGSGADFKILKVIYKVMDKWRLDPIIGFFIPGLGDVITTVFTIPFIFTSIFKLRSVPPDIGNHFQLPSGSAYRHGPCRRGHRGFYVQVI